MPVTDTHPPRSEGIPAVRAEGICMDFPAGDRKVRVLHDINLNIPLGRLTMLVGPSGCGKTTLISILSGILTPSEGEVEVLGERLSTLKDKKKVELRRHRLGFIFQQYNLLGTLTASQNAGLPLVAAGHSLDDASEKAVEVLAAFGLADHVHKLPSQLSGGQQQRVAIARALVHDPQVVVCDEPTAALDARTGQDVMELLREKAATSDRAVIVVTHDNRIYHFADHVVLMEDGRITGEKSGDAFTSTDRCQGDAE